MKPIPFDHHDAALLAAAGYVARHVPACWRDDGDAENGPHLDGHPAYVEWQHPEGHTLIVVDGELVDAFDALAVDDPFADQPEPIPAAEASDSDWGAFEEAQR
jgi:hypothetical protein